MRGRTKAYVRTSDRILQPLSPPEIVDEVEHFYKPWVEACVNPGAKDRDRTGTPIDRDLLREAGEQGLLGFTLSPEVGGQGRSWREWGFVLHELGYHTDDTALPMVLAYCSTVTKLLYETGRSDIIDRYVRPMVKGAMVAGFAWSEGKDPFSFETVLRARGNDYVLDGLKQPIANGMVADAVLVFATSADTDDVMVAIVERTDPGVAVEPCNAMGLRAAGMASWRFDRVVLGRARLLVDADGLSWGQRFLNERRLEMPCWALGRMRRLVESCVRDVAQRIRYGRPLADMQTIQAAIGRMSIALESSRMVVRAALDRIGHGDYDFLWEPQLAIIKSHVVEQALSIARTIQDITGGYGVLESGDYERTIRDLQCLNPIAGTLATLQVDLGILVVDEIERAVRNHRRSETHEDQAVRESAAVLQFPRRDRG